MPIIFGLLVNDEYLVNTRSDFSDLFLIDSNLTLGMDPCPMELWKYTVHSVDFYFIHQR